MMTVRQTISPELANRFKNALRWYEESDAWDEALWDAFHEGDNTFNGNVKEFNQAFVRGLWLALNDPEYFHMWHDGFVEALGISIDTMVEKLDEKLPILEIGKIERD
jgi:hypothetical protein